MDITTPPRNYWKTRKRMCPYVQVTPTLKALAQWPEGSVPDTMTPFRFQPSPARTTGPGMIPDNLPPNKES